jgi:hypothetical protein
MANTSGAGSRKTRCTSLFEKNNKNPNRSGRDRGVMHWEIYSLLKLRLKDGRERGGSRDVLTSAFLPLAEVELSPDK